MRYRRINEVVLVCLAIPCAVLVVGAAFADSSKPPTKRAKPPKWPQEVIDVFFDDVSAHLVGERPSYRDQAALAAIPAVSSPIETPQSITKKWSTLIDAETIETEIKRISQAVAAEVSTPTKFKGGAYQQCRRHFSVVAMLFAIIGELDDEIRWSDAAPTLRDLFARAGYNCKVGTDKSYREASQRSQDLADLVRGSRPSGSSAKREVDWGRVADRAPLMQRLEIAHSERLIKWLTTEPQFKQNRNEIRHEAQLVAAIADVIGREGFEYWDDEQYAQYARDLREAASDIGTAMELEDYSRAKQALGRATKACIDCHDGYRG